MLSVQSTRDMTTVTIPFGGKAAPLRGARTQPGAGPEAQPVAPRSPIWMRRSRRRWPHPIGQPPIERVGARPRDRVLLVSDDNTRLTPADRMIPPLLRPAEPGRRPRPATSPASWPSGPTAT
ncbi:MAG: nickel-dependent lactate racemase [Desulfobacterales bacterium]|nr:nickel-dependent lactate racemase [Desulfobacterales bacterium]